MIGALEETPDAAVSNDDDDTPFTIVAHSKRERQLLRQQRATARHADSQPQPRQPIPPAPTRGQPIPILNKIASSKRKLGCASAMLLL